MHSTATRQLKPLAQGVVFSHNRDEIELLGRRHCRAESSDSGKNWAYFYGKTDEEIWAWMGLNNWYESRINSAHDCTGRMWRNEPDFKRVGQRVLLVQNWGYDI